MTALMVKIRQEHQLISDQVSQLFADTREFLSTTKTNRLTQAQAQAKQLHQFHQQLEQQTHDFLANTAKERMTQAQKQKQSLNQFRKDLFVSIFGTSIG
jgi:gas vesicle GvpC-like protein